MESRSNAVEFDHVSVERSGVAILDEVNAVIPAGSCTVIIGPNGAGKTTLLLTLLGEIRGNGRILRNGVQKTGYVPQKINVDRGMPFTVEEFLAMGAQRRPIWLGIAKRAREQAREALAQVQAEHILQRRVGTLSGGEMQRVLLALALQNNPDLLILDEPSAGVDIKGGRLFCELLEDLHREREFTQVMVTHDLGLVAHHASHVICLNKSVVAEGSPQQVLTSSVLQRLFGMHMGLICAEDHVHSPHHQGHHSWGQEEHA